jgi:hypothetical protein
MGEYAKRLDGVLVKIGTCENMYYLRWEDKNKVEPEEGSGYGTRYRLPFPDEDILRPGEYKDSFRGYPLPYEFEDTLDAESREYMIRDPGTIQLTQTLGLLINVPCYHALKLPDLGDARIFWNGKALHFELSMIREDKATPDRLLHPVVRCKACSNEWRASWSNVLPFIHDKELKKRLENYSTQTTIEGVAQ